MKNIKEKIYIYLFYVKILAKLHIGPNIQNLNDSHLYGIYTNNLDFLIFLYLLFKNSFYVF